MFDPNMPRWIMASCRQWFETNKGDTDLKIFYEYTRHKDITQGETRPEIPRYAEFRLNGPDYRKISGNEESYTIEINVLLSQTLIEGQADLMDQLAGLLTPCFTTCIPVYKYGVNMNPDNDGSLIGGLMLADEKDGQVNFYRFGQANPDTLFTQAALEAGYRMNLKF